MPSMVDNYMDPVCIQKLKITTEKATVAANGKIGHSSRKISEFLKSDPIWISER